MKAVGAFIPELAPWAGPVTSSRRSRPAAAAGESEASHVGGADHAGNGTLGRAATAAANGAAGHGGGGAVESALALLRSLGPAAAEAARFSLVEAADFAGRVEELSRTVEYFQLIAAAAVDRTRKQTAWTRPAPAGRAAETAAPAGWLTGWTQNTPAGTGGGTDIGFDGGSEAGAGAGSEVGTHGWTAFDRSGGPAGVRAAADDGYKNATEFLRARLRISAPEARRRLTQAADLLPRQGLTGAPVPAVHEELGAAVAAGQIASRTATIITTALDRVRHLCPPGTTAAMEHALTLTAIENDPDFLTRIARRWTDALDQDGAEPTEEALRRLQGAFIRKPRHGLHHLEIFATTDQFEHLITAMNTATNPRTSAAADPGPDATADPGTGDGAATDAATDVSSAGRAGGVCVETDDAVTDVAAAGGIRDGSGHAAGAAARSDAAVSTTAGAADVLDRRSRPQRLLDGLVGACDAALAAGALPAAGGLRPQVMATIDYRDLLGRLDRTGTPNDPAATPGPGTGTLMFTGPVTASTIRKIACDADIIPVLLGGEGRILDIGRTARIFPPHIRKALTARDQGCAFPQCTIPAPWCEAHHITYWSRGGSTSTDNGTLLCSHHHHLIHKEQWTIQMRSGIPWFIPPPHVDPRQTPRRNKYFRPDMPRQ
ncbi:DUF222 domain-containing protein [Arthrobacter sp. TE12232]